MDRVIPLAERIRPKSLEEYVGQEHLVGEGAILRNMIESGNISSFILQRKKALINLCYLEHIHIDFLFSINLKIVSDLFCIIF